MDIKQLKMIDKIKALFPLQGEITQDILDKADRDDIYSCVGALTLKKSLGRKVGHLSWGVISGWNLFKGGFNSSISTKGNINMMTVRKPRKVTFVLNSIS